MSRRGVGSMGAAALSALCLAGCAAGNAPLADNASPAQGAASIPMNAANLVGATPSVLDQAFGQPVLLRVDGPAQVWLYHSSVCGLNLILFPDHAGVPRVADVVPDNADALSCMQSLQQRGATDAALDATPAS